MGVRIPQWSPILEDNMQCLSVLGPCKELCGICKKSHEEYIERETKAAIEKAKLLLEYHGYKVIMEKVNVCTEV